jgi:hypothetical protein
MDENCQQGQFTRLAVRLRPNTTWCAAQQATMNFEKLCKSTAPQWQKHTQNEYAT